MNALRTTPTPFEVRSTRGSFRPAANSAPLLSPQPDEETTFTPPMGEIKIVSILSCALAESPAPGAVVAAEARYRRLQMLHRMAQQIVSQYGGWLQSTTGDDILAIFGAPIAQEDHARRAVLAALELSRQVAKSGDSRIADESTGSVRMGVHSEPMAIEDIEPRSTPVTPVAMACTSLAIALQERATANQLLCSEATACMIRHEMRLRSHGPLAIAGQCAPLLVYQVTGPRMRRHSGEWWSKRTATPLVGRDRELALMHEVWAQVKSGTGQVIQITGEAGIGKSRLVHEFRQSLRGQPVTYLRSHCLAHDSRTPYSPVLMLLRQACRIIATDDFRAVAEKIARRLSALQIPVETAAPYLLHLLESSTAPSLTTELSPELLKTRTINTLLQMSLQASRERPLIIELEDVHWIDAASEACLIRLVEQLVGAPILLLLTSRPGYRVPWLAPLHITSLALTLLTPEESQQVVHAVCPSLPILDTVFQDIVTKANGNPFFLEELARSTGERGTDDSHLDLPSTIQTVLAARLDQLTAAEKRLVQAASCIGSRVPVDLLQALTSLSSAAFNGSLQKLQAAELLYEIPTASKRIYAFHHVLIQDVAYQSLLASTRQQFHTRIAETLASQNPEIGERQPELVAHHYTEAKRNARAVPWWKRASQRAMERWAYQEAEQHCTLGLALLQALPDTPENRQHELDLSVVLGQALVQLKGNASPDVGRVYARARELCQQIPETPQLFPVLHGLRVFYMSRGELQTACTLGEQLFHLAQRLQNPILLQEAHYVLGISRFFLGELDSARVYLEHGMVLVNPQEPRSVCCGSRCRSAVARILWQLGYPDEAQLHADEALRLVHTLSSPSTLVQVLLYTTQVYHNCGKMDTAYELADEAVTIAQEHGFSLWLSDAIKARNRVLSAYGQAVDIVSEMQQGLVDCQSLGANLWSVFRFSALAEAYGQVGQPEDGLGALRAALTLVDKMGGYWWEAELHRLRGQLLLQQEFPDETQAEKCFQQALAVARRQQAKSLELRAVMGLCRLWRQQNKQEAALQLLTGLCNWFTEGWETADLIEAKALLGTLA